MYSCPFPRMKRRLKEVESFFSIKKGFLIPPKGARSRMRRTPAQGVKHVTSSLKSRLTRFTNAIVLVIAFGVASDARPNEWRGPEPLQENFDPVQTELPTAFSFTASSGRTVHYGTIGPKHGIPVLWADGNPSDWTGVGWLAPYEELLNTFNIRVIQPERIGTGLTPYIPCAGVGDPTCITPSDYADDWADLMHSLGYRRYSLFAVSEGGIYALWFMHDHWRDVLSLHLASALDTSGTRAFCANPPVTPLGYQQALEPFYLNPPLIWTLFPARDFATASSVPGLTDWFDRTMITSPDSRGASYDIFEECNFPVGNLAHVQTPVFIYYGLQDITVPISMPESEQAAFPNVVRYRVYPNDGHLASLRHTDQIFLDILQSLEHGLYITESLPRAKHRPISLDEVICKKQRAFNETKIVSEEDADKLVSQGAAILGICGWLGTPGE